MKFFQLLILLFLSFQLFAVEPSAVFSVETKDYLNHYQAEKHGSLFSYYKNKSYNLFFVSNDLQSSFSVTLDGYPINLKVFSNKDEFYITYWFRSKSKYILSIIKANNSGVIKKVNSDPFKGNQFPEVRFDGENIVMVEHIKKDYVAHIFSGNDLSILPNKQLELPDVGKAEWTFLGVKEGIMRFYGFIDKNEKKGIANPIFYVAMINNKNGKLLKEEQIEIPVMENKGFSSLYTYKVDNTIYVGPMFGVVQSPYTDDVLLYTFSTVKSKLHWPRVGMFLYKIKLDHEAVELVYQTEVPFLNGEAVTYWQAPFINFYEDDFMFVSYKERFFGGVQMGKRKYSTTAAIIDPTGKSLAHDISEEVNNDPKADTPSSEDINEFLKYTKKKNKTNFTALTTRLAKADPDAKIGVTRYKGEWIVIQYSDKTGKIKFYKV